MRVGILTFQWAVNYGAVLQMYALQFFLQQQGVNVEVIDFSPSLLSNQYNLNLFSKGLSLKGRVKKVFENIFKKNQYNKFKIFNQNNFVFSNKIANSEELKVKVKDYDLIIVGSDQVWNSNITNKYFRDYLLYECSCNKISYAASFGNQDIPNDKITLIKNALEEFKFISIREQSSIDYLKNLLPKKDLNLVLDPVFFLSKKDWGERFCKHFKKEGYILIYMLEKNSQLISSARMISKSLNIPIYSIEIPFLRFLENSKGIKKLHDIGPNDFITMFSEASYILTNSFHGTAFSLLFEKPFLSFHHTKSNMRIKHLLSLYGLENFQIDNDNVNLDIINNVFATCLSVYNEKELNIEKDIVSSKKYLINALKMKVS